MAFPVEWPADIWVQLLICAGLVAATVVLARIDVLRAVIIFLGGAILQATRLAAAAVIWLFDKVMPVDGRNGRLPRANFAVWILLNVTVVAAWIVTGEVAAASLYAVAAAIAAATFTVLNLLLLGAAYWAVRETVEVTNGDLAADQARFAEASPARNVAFVFGTAILLVMQIAVVVEWVQQTRAIALVGTDGAIGPRYLNFLLATIDSLPLAAFYVAPLSRHAWFATDLPALALARSLNALGSILIVSTALGLVQQRLAFRRMVDGLVNTPGDFPEALLARFKNAPSAIKGYVMSAFKTEPNDNRRLRLARLAIARRTYTFPQVFAANYAGYSERVRSEGAAIVADFMGDRTATFYATTLQNFFDACDHTERRRGFKEVDERRRIAPAYVAALERLLQLDPKAADARIRTVSAQNILIAVVKSRASLQFADRAANLLARVNSYEAVAPLLKAVVWFPEVTALTVLARITRTLGDRSIIVSPPARNLDLLKRMAAAGRLAHRALLSPAAAASLDRAMEKLDARLAAATAEIEKQRRRRERAAARRARAPARNAARDRSGSSASTARGTAKPGAASGGRGAIAAVAAATPVAPPHVAGILDLPPPTVIATAAEPATLQ